MTERREFLKILAVLGGAALLGACRHWPEGKYASRNEPREGGGDGGGGGGSGGY